jgi:hypothetical protein
MGADVDLAEMVNDEIVNPCFARLVQVRTRWQ